MATVNDYSTWNIEQSVAVKLATELLSAGWLIYWYALDGVEIPGGSFYPRWSVNHVAYEADVTFAAALAASRGILTLRGLVPANPTFVTRLTTDGLTGTPDLVHLPTLAMEVLPERQLRLWELGSHIWLRSRRMLVFGYARTRDEQVLLADLLRSAVEQQTSIDLVDHVNGSGTIGDLDIIETEIDTDVVFGATEVETFAIDATLRFEYIV